MTRLAALLLVVAACRSDGGPASVARVRVLAGDQPEPGLRVTAHTPDGEVVAEDDSDAVGIAELGVGLDSLITVRFTGERTTVITTTLPALDTTLEVHGPPRPSSPLVVGTVRIDAPPLAGATSYEIDVGCVTVNRTQFPESIDVTACSAGTDRDLDVLVRAFHDVGSDRVFDGYAAAHIPLVDGFAVFDVPAWKATGPALPLANAVASAEITSTFFVDGNGYAGPPLIANELFYYDEFAISASHLRARVGTASASQQYEVYGAGIGTFEIGPENFLPPLELTTTRTGTAYAWSGADLDADLVVLRVVSDSLTWEAILPADMTAVAPPSSIAIDGSATLTYMRTSPAEDLGVYSTTIVSPTPPTAISTTRVTGVL